MVCAVTLRLVSHSNGEWSIHRANELIPRRSSFASDYGLLASITPWLPVLHSAGPSMMPGGDADAWERIKPIVTKVAAQARLSCGRPLAALISQHLSPRPVPLRSPARSLTCPPFLTPQVDDGACVTYVGPGGAGNFVKMVHNGIEYGDMQARSLLSLSFALPLSLLFSLCSRFPPAPALTVSLASFSRPTSHLFRPL